MARFRRWQTWVVVLVVVSAILGGWRWWRGRTAASAQQLPYRIVAVRRGPIEVSVQGTGTVRAASRKELRPRVNGRVVRVAVKEGERVSAGQLLLELSSENLQLQLDKARLSLEQARRDLDDLLRKRDSLVVQAPFRGRLASLPVTEGQRVAENSLIATVVDDTRMQLVARFTRAQIDNIEVGQPAEVFLPDYTCTMPGTVTAVNRLGEPAGSGAVLYPVTIEIENPGGLTPGTMAQAQVETPAGKLLAVQTSTLSDPRPVEVRAAAPGRVAQVRVRENDRVEAGQVLAVLASEDLDDQIQSQTLRVEQAQLDVASLEDQVASTRVVAPIDGTVVDLPVAEGDEVTGNTLVAVVASYGQLEVVVPIDELDISSVSVGQQAVLTTEALRGQTFRGRVAAVAEEGRTQGGVGVFDVTVEVSDPGQLRAGMTVEVRIEVASKQDALLVPVEAVQQRGNEYFVWVPGGGGGGEPGTSPAGGRQPATSPAGGRERGATSLPGDRTAMPGGTRAGLPAGARAVPVQVGLVSPTVAEITAGLQEGDQVLVLYAASSGGQGGYGSPWRPTGIPGAFPMAPGRQGGGAGPR